MIQISDGEKDESIEEVRKVHTIEVEDQPAVKHSKRRSAKEARSAVPEPKGVPCKKQIKKDKKKEYKNAKLKRRQLAQQELFAEILNKIESSRELER